MVMATTVIILCGGRSTRMGQDKGSLSFGGESMLERVTRVLSGLCAEVIIVGRRDQDATMVSVIDDNDACVAADLETFVSVDTPEKYADAMVRQKP